MKSSAAVYKGSLLFVKTVARVDCSDQLSMHALIHSKKRVIYLDGSTRIGFHEIMTITCFCCAAINSNESGGLV